MTANDYKICRVCEQEKHIDEFYRRHNGNPYNHCKSCHNTKMMDIYHEKGVIDRRVAVNQSEILVIERLKANHIPASPGKTLGYKWADVVAWGCVLIECKYSSLRADTFNWTFSPLQQEQGLRAHIVVLCADYGHEITYHVFDANHPIFSNRNGKRKTGVIYMLSPKHRKSNANTLTPEMMSYYQDAWGKIETYRISASENLQPETFTSDWRVK